MPYLCLALFAACFFGSPIPSWADSSTDQTPDAAEEEDSTYTNPSVIQLGPLPPVDVGLAVNGDKEFVRLDKVGEALQETGLVIEGSKPLSLQDKRDDRLNAGNQDVYRDKAVPSDVAAEKGNHTSVGVSLQTSF